MEKTIELRIPFQNSEKIKNELKTLNKVFSVPLRNSPLLMVCDLNNAFKRKACD